VPTCAKLEEAKYIEVRNEFADRKPVSLVPHYARRGTSAAGPHRALGNPAGFNFIVAVQSIRIRALMHCRGV